MVSLSACKLFEGLSATELNTLRGLCRVESFAAGREIFHEGDPGDAVYVVRSGSVEMVAEVSAGERQVISRMGPGETFGEMSVIEFRPRSSTAVAAEPVVVYRIPAGEMLTFIHHTPDIAVSMMRLICARLREFNERHVRDITQAERLAILGQFVRSILHDIKNPLSVIGLSAEMAASESATPEFRTKAVNRIRNQVDRINGMIGEILDFSQGSGAAAVLATVDYAEFIRSVAAELRAELEDRGVALHFENDPPEVPLHIDPPRLRRVFQNLFHNAAHAMPDGGLLLLRFSLKQARVVTEIEDTGPGIDAEMAGKMFEPFATHGRKNGTGLGLSMCKRIIEDHRGRIWTETRSGRGATFIFSLPRPA
jgi:signal transduction histidine kinase